MKLLRYITFIFLLTTIISLTGNAQYMRNLTVGIKSGANFTIVNPTLRYSVFENSESANSDIFEKEYELFYENFAMNYAFILDYSISDNLELTFHPGFFNYNYKYNNEYDWTGSQEYSVIYDFKHSIRYVDLPLGLKYNLKGDKFKPFIHAGIYYGLRENSTKYITRTENSSLGEFEFEKETFGADSSIIMSNVGVFAGLGIAYSFKHSKIGIEANFRHGLNTITRKDYRYNNNTLTGKYYDIPDDMKLVNISIGIFYSVSLKCIVKYPLPQYRNY